MVAEKCDHYQKWTGGRVTHFREWTQLSAVDEGRRPTDLRNDRLVFKGNVDLRALPPSDFSALTARGTTDGAKLMAQAPLILTGEGVEMTIERIPDQDGR